MTPASAPTSQTLTVERVMACIDPAASDDVIHAAASLAAELNAIWYAVYVEIASTRPNDHTQHDAVLQTSMSDAERLGGIVVRVIADQLADGLIAFAEREGVTHVVFGRSAQPVSHRNGGDSVPSRLAHGLHGATLVPIALDH